MIVTSKVTKDCTDSTTRLTHTRQHHLNNFASLVTWIGNVY